MFDTHLECYRCFDCYKGRAWPHAQQQRLVVLVYRSRKKQHTGLRTEQILTLLALNVKGSNEGIDDVLFASSGWPSRTIQIHIRKTAFKLVFDVPKDVQEGEVLGMRVVQSQIRGPDPTASSEAWSHVLEHQSPWMSGSACNSLVLWSLHRTEYEDKGPWRKDTWRDTIPSQTQSRDESCRWTPRKWYGSLPWAHRSARTCSSLQSKSMASNHTHGTVNNLKSLRTHHVLYLLLQVVVDVLRSRHPICKTYWSEVNIVDLVVKAP